MCPRVPKRDKIELLGCLLVSLGALRATLGLQNGALGALGGTLGLQNGVLGALGAPLGDPWATLGSLWWKKGCALPNLGPRFGSIFDIFG